MTFKSGNAGGDLTGTYPSPTVAALAITAAKIANATITDTQVAAANKDGASGTASMRTLGTGAAQACAGNDSRLSDSRAPTGSAGGDLTGTYPNPTIALLAVTAAKIANTTITAAQIANTTITAAQIANATITDTQVAAANKDGAAGTASMRTLSTTSTTACAGNDARLSDSRAPNGSAGGQLGGTYPNPTVNHGTTSTTACAGDDARLSDSRAPNGSAGGQLGGTYPNPTVNHGTTSSTACAGDDSRLSDSRAPNGSAGGGLAGTYPNPTIAINALTPFIASINGFRITGVSATPVMTADSTSLSTIYLTPYKSGTIALYNGSTWDLLSSAEVSISVTSRTTDLPFDIFAYNSSGTVTLELLDWTSATARATALVRQDGVWCKTGALTRRYVGSCRARSATTFHWVESGSDAPAKFDLFNADNRVRVPFSCIATTNTWNYTTATWRQAQGSTNYQVDIMVGLQEEGFQAALQATSSTSTSGVEREVGIGYDSTTAFTGTVSSTQFTFTLIGATLIYPHQAMISNLPTIGRHFYAWLEISGAAGTTTWWGDNGALRTQSGMTGMWTC